MDHNHHHHHHGNDANSNSDQSNWRHGNTSDFGFSCRSHVTYLVRQLNWRENETILDYGCGAGSAAMDFFRQKATENKSRLLCMDKNEEAIQIAKNKYPDFAENFYRGDLMTSDDLWPLEGVKFDKIYANHVLQNIDNVEIFMEKIHGLLKEGGEFGAVIPFNPPFIHIHQYLKEFNVNGRPLTLKFPPQCNWAQEPDATGKRLQELFSKLGFLIVDYRTEESADEFADIYKLVDLVSGAFTHAHPDGSENVISELTPEKKSELWEFVAKKLSEILQIPIDQKPCIFRAKSLRFVVKKITKN